MSVDHEVAQGVARVLKEVPAPPPPIVGDWKGLRAAGTATLEWMARQVPQVGGVRRRDVATRRSDGSLLALRWYEHQDGPPPGSAVAYAHGGGMIMGSVALFDSTVAAYVAATGVPFLAVDYLTAPEAQGDQLARDLLLGVDWLRGHATALGVDVERIAVMGDSAGGGIAAAAAILARERGLDLAAQLLLYPMLDDRTRTAPPGLTGVATWTPAENITGWDAVLGGEASPAPAVSPGRLMDFERLCPAYVEVGDLDLFCGEDVRYADGLHQVGVPVELHVLRGVVHAAERFAPGSRVARRVMGDRCRVLRAL